MILQRLTIHFSMMVILVSGININESFQDDRVLVQQSSGPFDNLLAYNESFVVPIFNKTIYVTAESASFWTLGFVFGMAVESAADNMANITEFQCLSEVVSIIDASYSAYYFINAYYISNETDYFQLLFAGSMAVKAIDTTRKMECFGVGEYVNNLLFAGTNPNGTKTTEDNSGQAESSFLTPQVDSINPNHLPIVFQFVDNQGSNQQSQPQQQQESNTGDILTPIGGNLIGGVVKASLAQLSTAIAIFSVLIYAQTVLNAYENKDYFGSGFFAGKSFLGSFNVVLVLYRNFSDPETIAVVQQVIRTFQGSNTGEGDALMQ